MATQAVVPVVAVIPVVPVATKVKIMALAGAEDPITQALTRQIQAESEHLTGWF